MSPDGVVENFNVLTVPPTWEKILYIYHGVLLPTFSDLRHLRQDWQLFLVFDQEDIDERDPRRACLR